VRYTCICMDADVANQARKPAYHMSDVARKEAGFSVKGFMHNSHG
jgi:hypothetical protein